MKIMRACAAVFSLLAGPVLAADAPRLAPVLASVLAPAKPAGLKRAQDEDSMTAIYVIGGGALIAGIALLASDNGAAATPPAATTTTTST